jgi:hypothetical protein
VIDFVLLHIPYVVHNSSRIGATSNCVIVREMRNRVRETSSGVEEKDEDYWVTGRLYRF